MPTDLPTAPELPAVSPFLCLNELESESVDESPERHVSLRLHDEVVSRWRDMVRSRPFSPSGHHHLILLSRLQRLLHHHCLHIYSSHYRFTSRSESDEFGDEGSPETQSNMDSDIQEDIEAVTATAAITIDDGLEADDEAGAEVQPEGAIEIGVDDATRIDIQDDLLMPDAIERLGQLEEAIEELISRRMEEALAAQEANRNAGLIDKNQSQNRDDNDNGSGGNGNHANHNGDGNQNGGKRGAKRDARVARVCTYKDFLNCQPHNFSGMEGVTIGIDEAYEMPWKDLKKLMIEVYCPRNEIQKMVPEENDKIERFIWDLPDNIQGPYTVRCTSCKKVGYMARDYRTVVATQAPRAPNHGNKAASNDACRRAYALGGGDGNPDSNVVTGTFLLNNHYAYILFDSGVDRSFVSTTFSALIDIPPTALDAQVTKKETKDKSEENRFEDVPNA
nr:reverse transcriptase domain-containing protein [Tanacetum cinerariifolium]